MLISQFNSRRDNRGNTYTQGALAGGAVLGGLNAASAAKSVHQNAPKILRQHYKSRRLGGVSATRSRKLAGQAYRKVMGRAVGSQAIKGVALGAGVGLAGVGLNKLRKKYTQ